MRLQYAAIASAECTELEAARPPARRMAIIGTACAQNRRSWQRGTSTCCRAWRVNHEKGVLAGSHSITSSAPASSVGEMERPSALAVRRLIVISNKVGCCTGRSAQTDYGDRAVNVRCPVFQASTCYAISTLDYLQVTHKEPSPTHPLTARSIPPPLGARQFQQ